MVVVSSSLEEKKEPAGKIWKTHHEFTLLESLLPLLDIIRILGIQHVLILRVTSPSPFPATTGQFVPVEIHVGKGQDSQWGTKEGRESKKDAGDPREQETFSFGYGVGGIEVDIPTLLEANESRISNAKGGARDIKEEGGGRRGYSEPRTLGQETRILPFPSQ